MTPDLLIQARELVGRRLGLDVSDGRGEAVRGKLQRALASTSADVSAALARLSHLAPESPELMRFARYLTVGETYFFRDRACFQALEHQVLPALIAERRAAGLLQLRVWSAGCSTGEEPYSLAILLDRLLPDAADWRLTILATDINPDSLERAREAQFGEWSFRGTPSWLRARYFRPVDARKYELVPRIRDRVRFQALNLAEGAYPAASNNTSAMDLIFCRNVLMYFTESARRATIERLQQALVPGGWFAVAAPEASSAMLAPLRAVNMSGTTLFRKPLPNTPSSPPEHTQGCVGSHAPSAIAGEPAPRSRMGVPVPSAKPSRADLPGSPEAPFRHSPSTSSASMPHTPSRPEQSPTRRARELADRGEVVEAREFCEAAIRQDPLSLEPLLLLATLHEAAGDAEAARVALRQALFLDPNCVLAQFTLGTLLVRQGEKVRGKRLLERAARFLETLPRSAPLEHGDGTTAGDLLGRALRWLETN